jgi:hypothetical protein
MNGSKQICSPAIQLVAVISAKLRISASDSARKIARKSVRSCLTGVRDMKHLVSKFRASSLLRIAAITGLGLTASGCVYDGGFGLGYASDGYDSGYGCDGYSDFDSYYGCDSGYGFSNIGYGGGWYSNYYYPGYGYYVFDSYGRRHQMHNDHRRYWGGQRYNWYRENGRRHGRDHGRGYGRNNNHNDGDNNYGGHHGNGNGPREGNGNGGHHNGGNGNYGGNNNRDPRPGILDGGFGRRGSRSGEGRGGSIQNPAPNPDPNNAINVAQPPRNIDRGNRGGGRGGNGMLNGGFGRGSQDNGASAPAVRQTPQVAREQMAPPTPRATLAPRPEQSPKERTETLRRRQEK